MMSLYESFKIIFGIIISVFILAAIVMFMGNYTQVQEDANKAQTVRNFLKTSGDVYVTGNPVSFDGFSGKDPLLSFEPTLPGNLISDAAKNPVYFPLFFSSGDRLFIYRETLDMGWWKFHFVEAVPRTRVLFNPVDTSPETWDLVRNIVSTYPSTEFFKPKVTFGFCDGSSVTENLCFGSECERQDFTFLLSNTDSLSFSECTANLPDDSVLIKILPSQCPVQSSLVTCLSKPDRDSVGEMRIGSKGPFVYKDSLDVVAATIGGGKEDIFGNSGATLFEYKNKIFREEILLATRILSTRANLISLQYTQNSDCLGAFTAFQAAMDDLSIFLEGNEDYYTSIEESKDLVEKLRRARSDHQTLANRGCDY